MQMQTVFFFNVFLSVQNQFLPKVMYLLGNLNTTPPSSPAHSANKLTHPKFMLCEGILRGGHLFLCLTDNFHQSTASKRRDKLLSLSLSPSHISLPPAQNTVLAQHIPAVADRNY